MTHTSLRKPVWQRALAPFSQMTLAIVLLACQPEKPNPTDPPNTLAARDAVWFAIENANTDAMMIPTNKFQEQKLLEGFHALHDALEERPKGAAGSDADAPAEPARVQLSLQFAHFALREARDDWAADKVSVALQTEGWAWTLDKGMLHSRDRQDGVWIVVRQSDGCEFMGVDRAKPYWNQAKGDFGGYELGCPGFNAPHARQIIKTAYFEWVRSHSAHPHG